MPVSRLVPVVVGGAMLVAMLGVAGVRPVGAQSVGPRISPAWVTVESPIAPDTRADLPALVVRNEGSDALEVQMGASADDPAVASWTTFEPSTFSLAPGEARVVGVRVSVPRDAVEGARRLRLRATTTASASSSGVALGFSVAVATVVDFTVGWPEDGASDVRGGGVSAGPSHRDLVLAVGLALATGAATYLGMKHRPRLQFRSPVVRRPPPEPSDEASPRQDEPGG